jgi:hypothetical protein
MSATASTDIRPRRQEGPDRGTVRCAGVGALLVAAAHAWAATAHHHDLVFTALIGLMTVGCVVCSVRCLRMPCLKEARSMLIMSAAMAAAHVVWLLAAGGGHHGGAMPDGGSHTSSGLTMVGLALAEVGVAALCAVAIRRQAKSVMTMRFTPGCRSRS